jgi:arsenical pump membrane protein
LKLTAAAIDHLNSWPSTWAALAAASGIAVISNLMNNLPSGLISAATISSAHVTGIVRDAVLIGVDLGPNLSVTGSLATILWLVAIRREGLNITFWDFLRWGSLVMPPALIFAVLALKL